MPCRIVIAPSFAALELRLWTDLEADRAGGLSPRWVVTPTQPSAARLRVGLARRVAAAGRALGGVRVTPLPVLVRHVMSAIQGRPGPRWSPAYDLLLRELVNRLDDTWLLSGLAAAPGGYRRAIPTLRDLADAGFGENDRDALLEAAAEPELPDLARESLQLYVLWIRRLRSLGLEWQPLQQQALAARLEAGPAPELRAVLGAEPGQSPEVLVHGFYDFTDVNLAFLAALSRHCPVRLYLPVAPGHATFAFAEEVLEECRLRFDHPEVETAPAESELERYFLETFPDGTPGRRPSPLTWSRASGIQAEALSAAAVVRRQLDRNPDLTPGQVLVVAPDLAAYAQALRTAFADFAIPLAIPDHPTAPPAEAPLRALLHLLRERASRDRVLQVLRDDPELPRRWGVDLDGFERKLRNLPPVGGEGWPALLEEPRPADWTEEERRLIAEIHATWVAGPAAGLHAALSRVGQWLPESAADVGPERILHEAESAGATAADLTVEDLVELAIRHAVTPVDRAAAGTDAVLVMDPMRARGITATYTVLLGLSVGGFPFRIDEDPLLPDTARRRLRSVTAALGHRLSLKTGARQEMLLLFHLLNASAEQVHWVIPEADELGKAVAPTPWVQRYLHAWSAQPDAIVGWRLPRSPMGQARALEALQPADGGLLPPGLGVLLGLVAPDGAGVPAGREDGHSGLPGFMPQEAACRGDQPTRVSVSRLETLARCPYQFWASTVARLQALEPPAPSWEQMGLYVGSAVHSLLQRWLEPAVRSGRPVSAGLENRLEVWTRICAEYADFAASPGNGALRLLPRLVREWMGQAACRAVASYLQAVAEGRCSDAVPVAVERPVTWSPEGMEELAVTARIDRLDAGPHGLVVVDYKTGRNPFGTQDGRREMRLGFRLQPFLYPRMLAGSGEQAAGFRFVFIGGDDAAEVPVDAATAEFPDLAGLLEPAVRGCFVPMPGSLWEELDVKAGHCGNCAFTSLCRRCDPGAVGRFREALKREASLRWADLTGGGEEDTDA